MSTSEEELRRQNTEMRFLLMERRVFDLERLMMPPSKEVVLLERLTTFLETIQKLGLDDLGKPMTAEDVEILKQLNGIMQQTTLKQIEIPTPPIQRLEEELIRSLRGELGVKAAEYEALKKDLIDSDNAKARMQIEIDNLNRQLNLAATRATGGAKCPEGKTAFDALDCMGCENFKRRYRDNPAGCKWFDDPENLVSHGAQVVREMPEEVLQNLAKFVKAAEQFEDSEELIKYTKSLVGEERIAAAGFEVEEPTEEEAEEKKIVSAELEPDQ